MPSSSELWNVQAESAFLACLLRNPDEYYSLNSVGLKADDFMDKDAGRVMKAIQESVADKNKPNLPDIIEHLKLNGWDDTETYVGSLSAIPVSITEALSHAQTIHGLAISRKLTHFGAQAIQIGRENRADPVTAIMEVKAELRKLETSLPEPERSPRPEDIIRRIKTATASDFIPVTFSPKLQQITGGFAPGWLWVIGGFSSTGKSAFGVNIALDAVRAHKRVVIFSTEMTQEQYVIRLLSSMSGVPQRAIRDGISFSQSEQDALAKAEQELARSKLLIYDTLSYFPAVMTELVKLKHADGVDLVIIDFLQNLYWHGDEVRDARETIIALQNEVAKKLSCAVVVFSQISNAYAQYDLDSKSDKNYYAFKGSGAIKDAADVGIMLRRDRKRQSPLLQVAVEKNRNGELGEVWCVIELPTGKITEADDGLEDEDE